jgi:UDP-3-O-[3-hydroxymyristoyl] glucosamine N-acyltransferase
LKLSEIAKRLECDLEGDGDIEIRGVAGIEHAQPGDVTFIANPRYHAHITSTMASAVIAGPGVSATGAHAAILRTDQPYVAFARVLDLFTEAISPATGIHQTSCVAPDARLGPDVSIGPFVTIGANAVIGARTILYPGVVVGPGSTIGDDCIVHANVSVRERVSVGNRVVLQDGAVVGSDGFGFAKQPDGTHLRIPQRGGVVIEDDVEIGANTTIDRPAVGETRIGAGTKIDNLVQIAHGVSVGRRVLFAAQVGVAGSTTIEDDVVLAGQVGIAGHLRIGKGVVATAQTGVPNSVGPGEFISGYPAIGNREWLKSSAVFRQLPALHKQVADLDRRIAELQQTIEALQKRAER